GAHAFLAGRHEVESENPFVERDFAVLHDGSDRDREGRVALLAPAHAGARALASHERDAGQISVTAMTAGRTIRPIEGFKMLAGFVGVGEDRVQKVAHGNVSLCPFPYASRRPTSSI